MADAIISNNSSNHQKCSADGCDRLSEYGKLKLCQKHYFRFWRTGTVALIPLVPKPLTETPNGYLTVYGPGHRVGNGKSRVYQHRVVMYEMCGEGPFQCALCSLKVTWETLHIDHINENKKDNRPDNLRITCISCNTKRTLRSTIAIYECNGKSLSLTGWSKEPGVTVGRARLKQRIDAGICIHDALYLPNKTHPPKKYTIDDLKVIKATYSKLTKEMRE